MDYKSALGINPQTGANEVGGETLFEYVNMRLSAAGLPVFGKEDDYPIVELSKPLLENYREFSKLSAEYYCPPDSRIMNYLENYLSDVCDPHEPFPSLPHKTFVLDRFGTARTLSLPPDSDKHENPLVSSYRVRQGILNNPRSDRRTTAGVFHVAEGGQSLAAELFHGGLFLRDAGTRYGRSHDHGAQNGGYAGHGDGLVHAADRDVFGPGMFKRKNPHDDLFRLRGFKGGYGALYLCKIFRGPGHGNDVARIVQRGGQLRREDGSLSERIIKLFRRARARGKKDAAAFTGMIEVEAFTQNIPVHVKSALHPGKKGELV